MNNRYVQCQYYGRIDKHADFYIRMNTNYQFFLYVQIHQLLHVWREEKITLRQRVLLAPFHPLNSQKKFFVVENIKYQLGLGMA